MTIAPESQFRVYLHDRPVGVIHRRGDHTRFSFDPEYIHDPARALLGLRFEENLKARHAANMRVPPWFSNLLPEGRLREWIGEARGVSINREMELLAEIGRDLPGAVRVLPADQPLPSDWEAPVIASSGPSEKRDSNLWRFSLAGVGLKFSMLARGDRFTAPGTGEGGDWIIKLPEPTFPRVPLNELAMMTLAGAAGIETPEAKLVHRSQIDSLPANVWPEKEEHAYAVRRFDRGPHRQLVHVEDLAQVRGFYPDDKYHGTYETVGALIYRQRDPDALREFARRLAFNVLIGNGDAHLKNWSLIYRNPRVPTLAPAYDLVATEAFRPAEWGDEQLALSFGGTKRFDAVGLRMFEKLDAKLGAHADLADVVASFVPRVLSEWPRAAELLGADDALRVKLGALIHHRAARLLR